MHFQHRFRLLPGSITRRFARRARAVTRGRPRTARAAAQLLLPATRASVVTRRCCTRRVRRRVLILLLLLDSPQLLLLHLHLLQQPLLSLRVVLLVQRVRFDIVPFE